MRRVFLSRAEIPGLVRGAVTGEPVALRRILGARRGGRYGAMLALAATLLAVPFQALAPLALVHAGLSVAGHLAARPARIGPRQYQRMVTWTLAPTLLLAAPFRLVGGGEIAALLALAVAHGLLWRGLRGGLDDVQSL